MKNILIDSYSLVEERLDPKVNYDGDRMLARHTKWIANSATIPIIESVWGIMINERCHVFDSYSKDHKISKQN